MRKFFERFGKQFSLMRDIAWFFVTIVIPLTAWLVIIRKDVSAQAQDVIDLRSLVQRDEAHHQLVEDKLGEKLDGIKDAIGEVREELGGVKGELRRIRR